MDITVQQVIEQIDAYALPFIVEFSKSDGSIRQMVAVKRNRLKKGSGEQAAEKSKFKYSLNQKNLLLIEELTSYQTKAKKVKGVGTVHELISRPDVKQIKVANEIRRRPVNIKIHSIMYFNGQKVWA